ncbi:MAG TPA: hypothetical protein PK989_14490, partial [Anaerolineales bacterium]|nr:hypothetical protein [Anaerolineales bacterium]
MFYGFSVLFFVLSLVTGLPALLRLSKMEKIRKNSASTFGAVRAADSDLGWLMTGAMGRVTHPLIEFQVNGQKHIIQVNDNRGFLAPRYDAGDSLEVIYDKDTPWKAYIQQEWRIARADSLKSVVEIILAIVLWETGVSLGMPL